MASNRALVILALWFVGFGAVGVGYMCDYHGWLTRAVDQRVVTAQHAAFDVKESHRARRLAQALDHLVVRRQQRLAAGIGIAMCIGVVALCSVTLATRVT
jgi:hypothetical protein